ncbi:hypothetical protein [Urbifossiella limnaea]|uniref:Uncharacterized protein n=1 Tax=Urbifossiella limnaea TaxID=2528023 RepID=A0A517XW31_9BACT|nr:hypothetical protein [Urbifossiella limnaea]QDU21709.1 hypothetical protein ETAA1_36820 [Urbifossiella limnaea]
MAVFNVTVRTTESLLPASEPDEFVSAYTGTITSTDEETREVTRVGKVSALRVNAGLALNAGFDLSDVCDAHSSELAALHTLLYVPGQYHFRRRLMARFEATQSDLLVLDYVVIHPRWRQLRLGLLAARRMVDMVGAGCGLAVSRIAPVRHRAAHHVGVPGSWLPRNDTSDERREAVVSLRRYFRRMGFARLGRTRYYALPLNLVTPTAAELLGGRAPDS